MVFGLLRRRKEQREQERAESERFELSQMEELKPLFEIEAQIIEEDPSWEGDHCILRQKAYTLGRPEGSVRTYHQSVYRATLGNGIVVSAARAEVYHSIDKGNIGLMSLAEVGNFGHMVCFEGGPSDAKDSYPDSPSAFTCSQRHPEQVRAVREIFRRAESRWVSENNPTENYMI